MTRRSISFPRPAGRRALAAGALTALLAAVSVPSPLAAAPALSAEAAWLAGYLALDTSNPPGREAEAAEYLAAILRARGVATERHVTPAGRTSLVARVPPTVAGAPWIALVHHLDVVPPGEGWSVGPFAAERHDGYLYGRGAVDSKSLGVAHLAALLAAAREPLRARGLLYLAVADEENGSLEGMGWLAARRPELFAGVEAALLEGGMNRTALGRTLFWGLEVAQKRAYWLEVETRGRAGHGSSLNPASATHELVRALARAVDRPPAWRLQAPVAEFFRRYGALDPQMRRAVTAPETAVGPDGPAAWVPAGWRGLLLDTLQVTMLAAGDRPNVAAGVARARIDLRLLPETDAERYLAELADALGPAVAVRVALATPPSPPSPADTAVWRTIAAALTPPAAPAPPLLPVLIAGITDARFFRQRGIPAYGFSPFELEGVELLRVHGVDERIPLDRFDAGVERMRRVVRALVAPPG